MGYSTDFWGSVELTPALTPEQNRYLSAFNATRRMKRDPEVLARLHHVDPLVGPSFGVDGEFYVGGEDYKGQGRDDSIIDYNTPPRTQPSLWCGWRPNEDGTAIEWDESEKFYDYIEWMEYIIEKFIEPWGITANGEIDWDGEDSDDRGKIVVTDNVVSTRYMQWV
jgi:hypothetical protein